MEEILKIVGRMDPEEALTELSKVLKMLFLGRMAALKKNGS